MTTHQHHGSAIFEVENIGGITTTDQAIPPGVTVLTGENATNRTSFLQAVMAALGSRRASVKADADSGRVSLTVDDETYTRDLRRTGGSVQFDGDPYLDDPEDADLFAFLLEDNEARQAVIQRDSLREIIMRPVDTVAIESDIKNLEEERQELDAELERLDDLKEKPPELESRKQELEAELESTSEELEARRTELAEREGGVKENQEQQQALDEKLEELNRLESERDRTEHQLESEHESLAALRTERKELGNELEALETPDVDDPERLSDELEGLRSRKAAVESTISRLDQIIKFNEDTLSGDQSVVDELEIAGEERMDTPTDQLLENTVRCWTCGSEVEQARIETMLDELRSLRQDHAKQRNQLRSEIEDLNTAKREAEQHRQDRDGLKRKRDQITAEIEDRKDAVETLSTDLEELEMEIDRVKSDIEELETTVRDEVLELHSTVNRLEFKREQRAEDLDEVREEINSVETELDRREQLEAQRSELTDELTNLRTRIEAIESEAIDEFNANMDHVLDVLEYENLARIWLERKADEADSRRVNDGSRFELHVVRETEDGTVYEDTVEHLSESEREVTGLVFGLAGYLVHDLHETVPFMLLDSLEAIDSARLAKLVEHFSEYPTYLVVALLPEDAAALDDSYTQITQI